MRDIIAHPIELRKSIVDAFQRGEGGIIEVSKTFGVGSASLTRWLRLAREKGSLEPKPHGGGRRSHIDEAGEEFLKRHLKQSPDTTLAELVELLDEELDIETSVPAVSRALKRMKITRKKNIPRPRKGV